jgi:prephenate dehydrogenase
MNSNKNIVIVGLGLMGGSLASSLTSLSYNVYGYDINEESISFAYNEGIIKNDKSNKELLKKSDIIILCLYPKDVVSFVKENLNLFKEDVLICDITGVKSGIVNEIQNLLSSKQEFIGLHPMCGKEKVGVKYYDSNLFEGANLIIVPTNKNTSRGLDFAYLLGNELKFKFIEKLSIEEHDQMISFLSQLPHAIAVGLMNVKESNHLVAYTGDSFRDLTRIAKINAELWSELFFMNKEYLTKDIDDFIKVMEDIKTKINTEDKEGLVELFKISKQRRENFDK